MKRTKRNYANALAFLRVEPKGENVLEESSLENDK